MSMASAATLPSRILITGGCGFIGRNLIPHLLRSGDRRITVLDNFSVGNAADLDGLPVAVIEGDIRDAAAVDAAVSGHDAIIHLAGQTGVIPSQHDPVMDCDVNVKGTLTLLEAARKFGTKRFVAASSSAPVGAVQPPMHEDLPPRPMAPYGASKLAMEGYCSAYFHSFGVPTLVLRFSNCYGPGSVSKGSAVALFMKKILDGESLIVYGDGSQTRDFIFVGDLCRAIECCLDAEVQPDRPLFGETLQIATGQETTVAYLVEEIRNRSKADLGIDPEVIYKPVRAGEVHRNYSSVDKAEALIGFKAEMPFSEGLDMTWRYFLDVYAPTTSSRPEA